MSQPEYEIEETHARVWRRYDGLRYKSLSFGVLATLRSPDRGPIWWLQLPREARETYLVARDELLDRGLIPEAEEGLP